MLKQRRVNPATDDLTAAVDAKFAVRLTGGFHTSSVTRVALIVDDLPGVPKEFHALASSVRAVRPADSMMLGFATGSLQNGLSVVNPRRCPTPDDVTASGHGVTEVGVAHHLGSTAVPKLAAQPEFKPVKEVPMQRL